MSSPPYGGWGYGEGGYGGGGPSALGAPSASLQNPSPTIIYRQLGPNNDPRRGQGQADFLTDRFAVAQAVVTRLLLLIAEWWESLTDGTPVWQQMLAVPGAGAATRQQQISLLIQQRILGTPYVVAISNVQVSFNGSTRSFSFYAQVQTAFGTVSVFTTPAVPAQGLPS
jgi:hypothetical protein